MLIKCLHEDEKQEQALYRVQPLRWTAPRRGPASGQFPGATAPSSQPSAGVVSGAAGRGRQHGGDSSTVTETHIQESGTDTHLCVHTAGQSAQLTGWHRQHTGLPSPELWRVDFPDRVFFVFLLFLFFSRGFASLLLFHFFFDAPEQSSNLSPGGKRVKLAARCGWK